jgi:hypothetical protein
MVILNEFAISGLGAQFETREVGGVPGVAGEVGNGDFFGVLGAEAAEGGHVQMQVARAVGRDVLDAAEEEADGGLEAAAMFGVMGMERLELQVDEGAGDLDEAFVKGVVFVAALQPEMLEHVVGFVVFAGIEAGEIALITRVEVEIGIGVQALYKGSETVAFFHRALKAAKLFSATLCLTRNE